MRDDQHQLLIFLVELPARLTASAWVLNCQPHDVPALVAATLLKRLANYAANSSKFFATADLLEQIKDCNWLSRVSAAIYHHWQSKNGNKPTKASSEVTRDGEDAAVLVG
jgi:hypothetical protein